MRLSSGYDRPFAGQRSSKGRENGLYFERPTPELKKLGFFLDTWSEACAAEPIRPDETAAQ
jgi:hypothetical protein